MEPRQESSNAVALHLATSRNISSSSSSAFFSATQSPFISPPLEIATPSREPKKRRAERKRGNPPLPSSSGWQASSDVYIGFHGRKPSLLRFTKWVSTELEMHGISCFKADRARCKNARSSDNVERAMRGAAFGVIVLTEKSFSNSHTVQELGFFLSAKNFVPIFFDILAGDCLARDIVERRGDIWERHGGELWTIYGGEEREWREVVDQLSRFEGVKIETREDNRRDCVIQLVLLLAASLGRRSTIERINKWRKIAEKGELPFPRKKNFVGRKKELTEMEFTLFGDTHEEYSDSRTQTRRRRGKKKEFKFSGKGIVCVSGESGIGKTELLLEYSYRFSQRYKTIFWVSGESRYLRQNYLKLRFLLEVDTSVELGGTERVRPKCLEEQEEGAIARVRRELSRDIPYLIVIDNLESEEDWFDQKSVVNLLPPFGGETHIIISTRLPEVISLEPMKLSYLSATEAIALMNGNSSASEVSALQVIEERLERLPLGLSIVGSILSEIPISPSKLLDTINRKLDNSCRRNRFMKELLDLCLSIFHHAGENLAVRMLQMSSWFPPGPVPISLLAMAAKKNSAGRRVLKLRRERRYETEAASILIRFGLARTCVKEDCICFQDYVKLHSVQAAGDDYVKAVTLRGSVSLYPEQIWAASFLLFSFGDDPPEVKLEPSDLLQFVKRAALPLAVHSFFSSRCGVALELLRRCAAALDAAADALISGGDDWIQGPVCCGRISRVRKKTGMQLWRDLGILRAGVLETRAKLMVRGGLYDEADELVRKAIFIRTSISGEYHPDTIAARETLAKLTRLRSSARLS